MNSKDVVSIGGTSGVIGTVAGTKSGCLYQPKRNGLKDVDDPIDWISVGGGVDG